MSDVIRCFSACHCCSLYCLIKQSGGFEEDHRRFWALSHRSCIDCALCCWHKWMSIVQSFMMCLIACCIALWTGVLHSIIYSFLVAEQSQVMSTFKSSKVDSIFARERSFRRLDVWCEAEGCL